MSKVAYNQTGYVGQRMSVRAMEAYEAGEMPKSKWTKSVMLEVIATTAEEEEIIITPYQFANLQKLTRDQLFNHFFEWKSWHHTGKFANETDFYGIDEYELRYVEEYAYECKAAYMIDVWLGHSRKSFEFSSAKKRDKWLKDNNFRTDTTVQVRGGFEIRTYETIY